MALSFDFFADALLTDVLAELTSVHLADGSSQPVDHRVYLGSPEAGRRAQADSQPGVDPIIVSVVDAAPGSGHAPSAVRLATSQAGLDTATPGASLQLAAEILSGDANAVEIWLRVADQTGQVGESTELSLQTNTLRETAV